MKPSHRISLASLAAAALVVLGFALRPSLSVSCAEPGEGSDLSATIVLLPLGLALMTLIAWAPIAGLALFACAMRLPVWSGALCGALAATLGAARLERHWFFEDDSCSNPFWDYVPSLAIWPYAIALAAAAAWAFHLTDRERAQRKS